MESYPELTELRVFLVRHKLRQEDFADAVGISRVALGNLMLGKSAPRKPTIDAILAHCRSIDPSITYEQIFGSVVDAPAPEAATA